LDTKDTEQQFANRLRQRKGEPLGLATLAASGLPVTVDPSLARSAESAA